MINIRDEELHSSFHAAIRVILENLTEKLGVQIKDVATSIDISGLYKLFRTYFPQIKETDTVKRFEQIFLGNENYAKHVSQNVGVKNWYWPFDITTLLEHTVVYYIHEHGLDYNEKFVNKYYENLELFLIDNKIKIFIKTPVNGLRTINKETKINDEVSFIQLEGQRKIRFTESTSIVTYVMAFHDLVYTFYQTKVFESDSEEIDLDEKDWKTTRAHIRDFMIVLRLYRSGKIGFLDSNLEYSISHAGNTWQNQDCGLESDWEKWKNNPYILLQEDAEKLRELWDELHKIDFQKSENKFLLSAIDRFMESYQKDNIEDKILDLMICLESLLQDNPAELRFRLSIRTALLIGEKNEEKNRIYKIVKEGYDVRSDTVHGLNTSIVKIENEEISLNSLHEELENIVRRSIRKFITKINNNEKRGTVIQNLDNTLFLDS